MDEPNKAKRVIKKTEIFDAMRENTKSGLPNKKRKFGEIEDSANNDRSAKRRKVSKRPKRASRKAPPNSKTNIKNKKKQPTRKTKNQKSMTAPHTPIKNLPANDKDDPLPSPTTEIQNKNFKPDKLKFYKTLNKLKATRCEIDGEKFTLTEICKKWGIQPLRQGLSMEPQSLLWADPADKAVLQFIDKQIIPHLVKLIIAYDTHTNLDEEIFTNLRKIIAERIEAEDPTGTEQNTKEPSFQDRLDKILPYFATIVDHWGQKVRIQPKASEQDFTSLLYSRIFDPFFQDLTSSRCSSMPLPVPFAGFSRLPDMRAYIVKRGIHFTYFVREDSTTKKDEKFHKDLHKLIQLMRCALRMQTLHLIWPEEGASKEQSLYCFGILNSGYKIQLFQMRVDLSDQESYELPIYGLWAEEELNLSEYDEKSITTLLKWLIAIRVYNSKLDKSPDITQVQHQAHECRTYQKTGLSKTSSTIQAGASKQQETESKEDDSSEDKQGQFTPGPNNNNTNQMTGHARRHNTPYKVPKEKGL